MKSLTIAIVLFILHNRLLFFTLIIMRKSLYCK